MRTRAILALAMMLLSACDSPSPTFDVAQWCADNPRAVSAASSDRDDSFTDFAIADGVELQAILQWTLDDTPTREEHEAVLSSFDRWRANAPDAYERACRKAFAPG